jgi:hypothetical protein
MGFYNEENDLMEENFPGETVKVRVRVKVRVK